MAAKRIDLPSLRRESLLVVGLLRALKHELATLHERHPDAEVATLLLDEAIAHAAEAYDVADDLICIERDERRA